MNAPFDGAVPARAVLPQSLRDPQGRTLDYLRLSVTDRCNLRCVYCMPAEGIDLVRHTDVMSFEDLFRLAGMFAGLGVRKIRITGGEPLVRKGTLEFLAWLGRLPTRPEILLTTNGVGLADRLPDLRTAGVKRVNLSLDSLDRDTYRRITRRDELSHVLPLLDAIPAAGLGLKINVVVMPGVNDDEMKDFLDLTRRRDLTVRFIEPMLFAGGSREAGPRIGGDEILARLRGFVDLQPVPQDATAVDALYVASGHRGRVGIINGHSRTFCGTCNRLRLDTCGRMRTCLYGDIAVDLGRMLRDGADDRFLEDAVREAVGRRLPDGRAAEKARVGDDYDSMAQIGG